MWQTSSRGMGMGHAPHSMACCRRTSACMRSRVQIHTFSSTCMNVAMLDMLANTMPLVMRPMAIHGYQEGQPACRAPGKGGGRGGFVIILAGGTGWCKETGKHGFWGSSRP